MDRRRAGLALTLALVARLASAATQGPPAYVYTGTAPSGACVGTRVWIDALGTGTYYCNAGTWAAVSGGGGAPTSAQYWTGAADAGLSAEKNLGALATGLVLNTAGTPSAYGGGACTGANLIQSLNASGAPTCYQLRLDQLATPTADIQWNFTGEKVLWDFQSPVDSGFSIHGTESFLGDLVHIHQHSGNPSAGTDLLHIEATDPDVVGLKLTMASSAHQAATITGKVNVTGDVTASTFVGPLTGNAATASAPDVTPGLCAAGQAARGINTGWGATGCFAPTASPSSNVEILHSAAATAGVPLANSGTLTFNAAGWNTTDSLSEDTPVTVKYVPTARTASTGAITAGAFTFAGAGGTIGIPDTGASGTTYLRGDGTWSTPGSGSTQHLKVITANITNNTTTPTDIDGLSWSVAASTEYGFACTIIHQGTATGGPRFNLNGPASPTTVTIRYQRATSATADTTSTSTAFSAAAQTAAITSGGNTTVLVSKIHGTIINGVNAGTAQFMLTSSTAGQNVTVYRGSSCTVI